MKRGSKSDGTQDTFFVFEQTPSTLPQMIDFGYAPYFQSLTPSTLLCRIFAPYSPVLPVENLTLRTGLFEDSPQLRHPALDALAEPG